MELPTVGVEASAVFYARASTDARAGFVLRMRHHLSHLPKDFSPTRPLGARCRCELQTNRVSNPVCGTPASSTMIGTTNAGRLKS